MTYRDDDAAAHAHLASETQELERARRERDRMRGELAQLTQLKADVDAAIASRRGSVLSAGGYLRVAGLMVVMLAAGAVDLQLRAGHAWAHYALLGALFVGVGVSFWQADRRQMAAAKLLEEHDARMAARTAPPTVPSTRVADDVGVDQVNEREATQPREDAQA